MYRVLFATFAFVSAVAPDWSAGSLAKGQEQNQPPSTEEASERRLSETVRYLSSDELEGRGPGTEGLNRAAEFISGRFGELKFRLDVVQGKPFQDFELPGDARPGPKEKNTFVVSGPPEKEGGEPRRVELKLGEQFQPLALGGSARVEAPLVFAGYGITSQDPAYDDYEGIDAKGKLVIVLRKEPEQEDPRSKFNGRQPTGHAFFEAKVGNAARHGAAGVILVNDGVGLEQARREAGKRQGEVVRQLLDRRRQQREAGADGETALRGQLQELDPLLDALRGASDEMASGFDQLLTVSGAGQRRGDATMPVVFCRRAEIDELLKLALQTDLADLEREIDKGPRPRSADLTGWSATCETNIERPMIGVKNVIGVLEGSSDRAEETIVIGAHYDHLGMGGSGSLAPWTTAIHNGADDNASGTAAMLEVAHRLAARPERPRRRLVFVAFAGEERGLLGSQHYVRQPPFPLEQTVAMVNLDMVGRMRENKLLVYGTGTADGFDAMIEQLNSRYAFSLVKYPEGVGPSDHATFYRQKIPVFHFFTDTHPDYHRPSDDFERINLTDMRRVVDMVTEVVMQIDAAPERPSFRGRAVFGIVAVPGKQGPGYPIADVVPDGPAAKAGIRAGDVITKVGNREVADVNAFLQVAGELKAGDTIELVVDREGQPLTIAITLGTGT